MTHRLSKQVGRIQELCVRFGARRLELFGSFARGEETDGSSDIDFLVEFADVGWKGSFRRYMGLKLGLEDLLGTEVDLVEIEALTNPYFCRSIESDRKVLYAG